MPANIAILLYVTAIALASSAVNSALAQTPAAPAPAAKLAKALKAMDTNNDGMISREEAKGHPRLEKFFDAIDVNKDGQLSRDELKAFREAHKGQGKP